MKSSIFASVALVLSSATLLACSGAPAAETDTDQGAVVAAPAAIPTPAEVKAVLEQRPIKGRIAQVTVDGMGVNVVTPSALAIGEKITKALPNTVEEYATWADTGVVRPNASPGLNEGGLLSLSYSVEIEAVAHPSISTYTFDLKTGAALKLADVLTPAGALAVEAECAAQLNADPELAGLAGYCTGAAQPKRGYGAEIIAPSYQLEAKGLRLTPQGMPGAAFVVTAEGILVPWAKLKGNISHPSVKALADKAG